MKSFVMKILGSNLVAHVACRIYSKQPLVVLYHGVSEKNEQEGILNYRGKHVPVKEFEDHIKWLTENFKIVPLSYIEKLVAEKNFTESNLCAITFDDGYENNFTIAYPILKKYNIPATIFVATDFVERKNLLWPDRLEYVISKSKTDSIQIIICGDTKKYSLATDIQKKSADNDIRQKLKKVSDLKREEILSSIEKQTKSKLDFSNVNGTDFGPLSWEQMREMQNSGIVFGAHTKTHPILARQTPQEQEFEIKHSKETIAKNLGSCTHFAYPNGQLGDFNNKTIDALKKQNFKFACSTIAGRVNASSHAYMLPRVTLDHTQYGLSRFKGLVSNAIPGIKLAFKQKA